MVSRLMRALAPETSRTSRGGTPAAWASKAIKASFALPSVAAARTRALSTHCPSARCSMPSMASRPPRGVSRTTIESPPAATVQGRSDGMRSVNVRNNVKRDHIAQENDDENHHNGRDVDAPEIGKHVPNRAQDRL